MYPQHALGDYFRIKHGYAFKSEGFADAGEFILLTPGNFHAWGGLKLKGDKEKHFVGEVPDAFILARGDLIIAMTDLTQNAPLLGASTIVPESNKFLHNQRIGKIVDLNTRALDSRFLFYVFNHPTVREQIKATATGATVKHTAPDRIYTVKAPIPELATQQRIADILSAYDDLIENNTKRIKILEEMARSLYREWFVNFRFPGGEKKRLIDSLLGRIPEGWDVAPLLECSELLAGFAFKSAGYSETGVRLLRGDNVAQGAIRWDGAKYWPTDGGSEFDRYQLKDGDIVLAMDRPWIEAGLKVARVTRCDTPSLLVQRVARLRAIPGFSQRMLYCELTEPRFRAYVKSITTGANVPHISGPDILQYNVLRVPIDLHAKFTGLVDPILTLADRLMERNTVLRRTRDLLLPRLLSGEIDVSRLPVPAGGER